MPTAPSETTVVALRGTREPASGVAVDPALTEQLGLAADTELVEVVLVLRQNGVDAGQHAEVETLMRQAAANVPLGAVEYRLLPQLGVLIARAPAQLIRRLITQPAVVVASANRVADSADGAPLAGDASNVLRSAPVDQECAAQNDELARVFGRITLEHRDLAGWEDDGGVVAAATERAPQ
jgi:hypothetical protein